MKPEMVIKDKELVQRLESECLTLPVSGGDCREGRGSPDVQELGFIISLAASMIHWTRQIKEVLSAQESVETGENSGPLEEIEFWHNRCMDLSGISKQLVKKGVKHIESILHLAKSSYLAPFMKMAQQIQVCE